ncbi:kinesin-like protein KIN-14O isoform X1 [Jatropha curcas]|uniref:kinesin-like protein KIN-14O isoform X1 n=1 Tax=Jatropha curcas TaxID=180498 RepID=UPI001894E91B|nr:kinesin-like protein KIN-14O isoform X1 [Jatropha curcas]
MHHAGHKFHEVFQLKQGRYADLSAAKISEMMKSNSLDNAPTQSLLSVVNGILDESIERKNGEIPHRVACLLRKVVQEIERRISTQAEHLRTQNNLFKSREEKYQSRIRVLEALASGTGEETGVWKMIVKGHLQQIKNEKAKIDEKKPIEDEHVIQLMKEKEQIDLELSMLKKELEILKKTLELERSKMDEKRASAEGDVKKLMEDREQTNLELSMLKQELEIAKKTLELEKSRVDEKIMRQEDDVIKLMKEKEQMNLELLALKEELEMAKKTRELEKSKMYENGKLEDEHVIKLMKEKEQTNLELSSLKQELEVAKKMYELEKSKLEDEKDKLKDEDVIKLMEEKEQINIELSSLKEELEIAKRTHELEKSKLDEKRKLEEEAVIKLMKEKEQSNIELSALKQELEMTKKTYELHCLQMETEAKDAKAEFEERLKELGHLLEDSRNKVKMLEAYSESQNQSWKKKELIFQSLTGIQFGALEELRLSSECIKHELSKAQKRYSDEFNILGLKFKKLSDASENYHLVLAENRKLFNELQDLKGNIRVYCRVRPLLHGQAGKRTTIDYIGENGELVVANPSKQGKDGHRLFRFNKVYGQDSTQAEVFSDTQPLIRSVLDGYNVCIFAYGQTGSGKTYTMTGPNGATPEQWGVNYRALNDLFQISQNRSGSFTYEVWAQVFEIYNEQLRDLLSSDSSHKRLGIKTSSQSNGLAVPDATMYPVRSTSDVIQLMDIGLNNRAVSATALNERSSRSHSVVSIHVRGKDMHTGATLHGNLHLVDLAGSERVDRSEVTGDRLKEAQHINKSLSALGDVIFALAQKSSHVPYRNSKLTQLLQASLGGQAKTLMFVQLNPDVNSYSETMSTLKFAERVSGVELGTAKSSKEGRDVKDLMEQVASLRDTISKKDGEIERLQLVKDLKNVHPGLNGEKQGTSLSKYGNQRQSAKATYDNDNCSESSDKHSEADSQQSLDDLKQQNRFLKQIKFSGVDINQDTEMQGYGDADRDDRLSDISDGGRSAGTEPACLTDEGTKLLDRSERSKALPRARSMQRLGHTTPVSKDSSRTVTSTRKPAATTTAAATNSTAVRPPKRWQ